MKPKYYFLIVLTFMIHEASAVPLRVTPESGQGQEMSATLLPETTYPNEQGFGFTGPAEIEAYASGERTVLTSVKPFFFHVDLPEGNYRIRAVLGGLPERSETTVKAESRRLMVKDAVAGAGENVTVEFLVNIRTAALPDGGRVALKPREIGVLHWDERLTLEFGGERPALAGLEITHEPDAITVYLAGDSTVTDQPNEPWCAWGQMLPALFNSRVAVANHAESGLSIRSFIAQRRLDKVMTTLKAGDYVFVQFAHNDQKESGDGIGPFESYTEALALLAEQVREVGAHPVFVTSMYRRRFSGNEMQDTLGDYPVAMRQAAEKGGIPLIDLHATSRVLFEALGAEGSKRAFVHYPANTFPGQGGELRDDTHFSTYGSDLLARCVAEGIQTEVPGLARFLTEDLPEFDPASPPSADEWSLSLSPPLEFAMPDGS